ncbi:uncharacterized protein LOC129795331 isoform X2 [Lutzomyia longipalpis]|uniref:uncharacterized protein LOC129795331 isoform X1 n=1 Tax=Lutzomyia longipalpis TaxID=7200 RepID=UPI002483ED06|nr:uncharacterized protein LOC129795331 isoform X1 [Lutzomyia longipalpis]XP_055692462.1 uncharacterized protein LOC129795331 isoform X2 [Lutzomyia longipalpis]
MYKMTEEKLRGISSLLGCDYDSEEVTDEEQDCVFQHELLLHFCLRMLQLNCDNFSVGFNATTYPKFHNIVLECDAERHRSVFFVHVEHTQRQGCCITREHLNSNVEKHELPEDQELWARFNLEQYFSAVWGEKFSELRLDYRNYGISRHYVLLTNMRLDGDVKTVEWDEGKQGNIFGELREEGARIQLLDNPFNISPITSKFSPDEVVRFDPGYFRNNFTVVSNAPSLLDLSIINYEILKRLVLAYKSRSLMKILREELVKFVGVRSCEGRCERRTLFKEDFVRILCESLLCADLTSICDNFTKELSNWVKFHTNVLHDLAEKLEDKRVLIYEEHKKLSFLKIYEALKIKMPEILLIPSSKLKQSHRNALEYYEKKVILFIDDDENFEHLLNNYSNIIFVVGKNTNVELIVENCILQVPKCSFEEFTEATKEEFSRRDMKLQEHLIRLSAIQNTENRIYLHLLNDIFEKINKNEVIEFGRRLPCNTIPKPYIQRHLTLIYDMFKFVKFDTDMMGNFSETDMYNNFPNCIVKGDPGVGKTSLMLNIAKNIKNRNPHFWVEYVDLKGYLSIFSEKLKSISSQEFSHSEAKMFLLEHLITFGPCPDIDRDLLELYLTYEETPVIYLFIDSLNEIPSMFEKLVVNLIEKLSEMRIRIFMACRKNCKEILTPLRNFIEAELIPYDYAQRKMFLQLYWGGRLGLPHDDMEDFIMQFPCKFYEKFLPGVTILETPLYLRYIADIYAKDCEKFCQSRQNGKKVGLFPEFNMFSIFTQMLQMTVKEDEMGDLTRIYTSIAVRELGYETVLPATEDVYRDPQLLSRGLVTRTDDGKFIFTHRAFAEYFVANALTDEMENVNKIILTYLSEFNYDHAKAKFIFHNLIGRIKANALRLPEKDQLAPAFEAFMEFFKNFLKFTWMYYIDDIAPIYGFIEGHFSKQEIQTFNIEQYWECYVAGFQTLTLPQLMFLVETFDKFNEPEMINYILVQIFRYFVNRKTVEDDIPFLSALHAQMVKRSTLSEEEFFVHVKACMKECAEDRVLRQDLMFWYFKKRNITQTINIANVLKMKYEDNWRLEIYDMHFIAYLCEFEKRERNTEQFIREFLSLVGEGNFYQFISNYDDVEFTRDTFLRIAVNVALKKGWRLVGADGNSILYQFWQNQQTYLFTEFIKCLPRDKIEELTIRPCFAGCSLIEHFHADENKFYEFAAYTRYVCETLGEGELHKFLTPCKSSSSIEKSIENDLIFLRELSLEVDAVGRKTLQTLVYAFCRDKMTWQEESKRKNRFLFEIARFISKYKLDVTFDLIFTFLNTHEPCCDSRYDNYLHAELAEVDADGNNPLLMAGIWGNLQFLQSLLKLITRKKFIEIARQQNNQGRNFFHCIANFMLPTVKYSVYDVIHIFLQERQNGNNTSLTKLLMQQDSHGRTPFHSDMLFFCAFIDFISDDALSDLFRIQDENGENIMHFMVRDDNLFLIFHKYLTTAIIEPIKVALKMNNNKGQTPFYLLSRVYESFVHDPKKEKLYKKFDKFLYAN